MPRWTPVFARRNRVTGQHMIPRDITPLCLVTGLLLLQSGNAFAGRLLDFVRDYDLNDYAIGFALTTSQSPYRGTSNSTFAYPYLTSFRHPAFTDDWLLIRDENLGFRFVTDNHWELGIVGRVQTLGIGGYESPELQGIEQRKWAFEAAPLIGWRGSRVHAQFRSYWEVPNRHSGTTSELELSVPMEFARGFLVPAVTIKYLSSDYNDYYFRVSPQEATATLDAFSPGSALNSQFGFYLGYRITPRWLLKVSANLEFLDSSITESPIVDRDKLWSAGVGLAYNADVFQSKDHLPIERDRAFEVRGALFGSQIRTDARRDGANGLAGDTLGFEDFLGASDRESILQADVYYRVGFYHRIELSYFENDRRTATTLNRDFKFGDEVFLAGTDVNARFDARRLRLAYAYSLMRDSQKELGASAGISYNRFEVNVAADATQQSETIVVDSPLPTMGAFGSIVLGENWRLGAEVSAFALDIDRYSGYSYYAGLSLDRHFGNSIAAGVGYDLYATRLEASDEALRGEIRVRNYGPKFYVSLFF